MLTKTRLFVSTCVALGSFATFTAFSQDSSISFATDVNLSEWQAVLHAPEGRVDRQVKVVDVGNSHVAVGVLFRDLIVANEEPITGIVHTKVSEVYYITSGTGVLVTGGTMLGRRDIPSNTDIIEVLVGESFSTSVARCHIQQSIGANTQAIGSGHVSATGYHFHCSLGSEWQ